MTAAATGGVDDGDVGWRKALRYALTENPVRGELPASPRLKKARPPKPRDMPLFAMVKNRT